MPWHYKSIKEGFLRLYPIRQIDVEGMIMKGAQPYSGFTLFTLLSLFVLLPQLSGCALTPRVDAAPEKLSSVRSVTVIRPIEPKTYLVYQKGSAWAAFGLIGQAIQEAQRAKREESLTQALRVQGVYITKQLADGVAERLTKIGFETTIKDWPWEEMMGVQDVPIEKVGSSADSVLILQPLVIGFVSSSMFSDYVPTMLVSARLIGRHHNEKLYSRNHESGSWGIAGDPKTIPSTTSFADVDILMSDTKSAASALTAVCDSIAQSIAEDLQR